MATVRIPQVRICILPLLNHFGAVGLGYGWFVGDISEYAISGRGLGVPLRANKLPWSCDEKLSNVLHPAPCPSRLDTARMVLCAISEHLIPTFIVSCDSVVAHELAHADDTFVSDHLGMHHQTAISRFRAFQGRTGQRILFAKPPDQSPWIDESSRGDRAHPPTDTQRTLSQRRFPGTLRAHTPEQILARHSKFILQYPGLFRLPIRQDARLELIIKALDGLSNL